MILPILTPVIPPNLTIKFIFIAKTFLYFSELSSVMTIITRFIKLMKSEPRKRRHRWIIGEEKIFSIEKIDRIRNVCWKLKWDGIKGKKYCLVRDWFMIQLGLFTGSRVNEVSQLKIGDIHIRGSHSSVFVKNGKGGRKRNVWINAEFKKICEEFLKFRKHFGFDNNADNYVFVSDAGIPLSKRAIQKAFKRCIKVAGLSEKYSIPLPASYIRNISSQSQP